MARSLGAVLVVPILAGCLSVAPATSSPATTPSATPTEVVTAPPTPTPTPMPTTPPATPTTAADICTAPGDSLTVELEDLAEVDPDERLACFGDRTLILRGFVLFAERGGTCNPSTEPQWLVPSGCDSSETLTSEATQIPPLQGEAETIFNVIVHPEVDGVAYPWSANDHLEVTGSFDHPAALTCTTGPGSTADEEAQLVLRCRNQFVVTRAELVPGP